MRGPTLLARLRQPELAQPRRTATDREVRESILSNLVFMCNTRVGTMLTCDDYGIATISEMVYAFPEAISLMAATLKHSIQTYEPRLQNVQVVHIPSEEAELILRFEIRGRLTGDPTRAAIKFETTFDASRRLTIR